MDQVPQHTDLGPYTVDRFSSVIERRIGHLKDPVDGLAWTVSAVDMR